MPASTSTCSASHSPSTRSHCATADSATSDSSPPERTPQPVPVGIRRARSTSNVVQHGSKRAADPNFTARAGDSSSVDGLAQGFRPAIAPAPPPSARRETAGSRKVGPCRNGFRSFRNVRLLSANVRRCPPEQGYWRPVWVVCLSFAPYGRR